MRTPFADALPVAGTRKTADGYLIADCRVARAGNVQDYLGFEIGHEPALKVFRVYRPEDEVFRADSIASYAHRPVTMGHPIEGVTADNWRKEAIGAVGSEIVRDGEFVRVPLIVMDADAIKGIENGKQEISMGYDCDLIMEPGTTPDGRAYDAYQANLRINHCAVVDAGRAGPQCRIGDTRARTPTPSKGQDEMTKTVTVDGKQIEVAADVASAIEALQAKITASDAKYTTLVDTSKQLADIVEAHNAVKASEVAARDAKIADLEKKVPTADELDRLATERSALVADAKLVASDLDPIGKDTAAIKAEAVKAKLGDASVEGKSADYVAAAFDMLVSSAKAEGSDPIRDAFKAGGTTDNKASPRDTYLADISNAWKGA